MCHFFPEGFHRFFEKARFFATEPGRVCQKKRRKKSHNRDKEKLATD